MRPIASLDAGYLKGYASTSGRLSRQIHLRYNCGLDIIDNDELREEADLHLRGLENLIAHTHARNGRPLAVSIGRQSAEGALRAFPQYVGSVYPLIAERRSEIVVERKLLRMRTQRHKRDMLMFWMCSVWSTRNAARKLCFVRLC